MMKVAFKFIAIFLAIVGALFLGILAFSVRMQNYAFIPWKSDSIL